MGQTPFWDAPNSAHLDSLIALKRFRMTGFEIAGVVLGAPPLIFYALDNYKRMLKPLRRYARFETAVGDLENLVNTSRLKFISEIQILLSAIFPEAEAWAVVTTPEHTFWHDDAPENEGLLKSHLDITGGYETFMMHVGCIVNVLHSLQVQVTELVSTSKKTSGAIKLSKRERAKRLKDRICFCFRDGSFKAQLEDIGAHVRELKGLVEQRDRIQMTKQLYRPNGTQRRKRAGSLEAFVLIQESSKALFETIKCTKHTAHRTHFGLLPKIEDLKVAQIWFNVLFPRLMPNSSLEESDLGHVLRIESCLRSKSAQRPQSLVIPPLAGTCTSAQSSSQGFELLLHAPSNENRRKKVKFENDMPSMEDFAADMHSQMSGFVLDFCQWLARNLRKPSELQDGCIGCLDRNERHQLRFHVSKDVTARKRPLSVSLHQLLTMMKAGQLKGSLPFREKLRFAKTLSSAVLSFHNTPWLLPSAWNETNIIFCNVDADADLDSNPLPDPFISVSITASKTPAQEAVCDNIHITNLLVFRLGIMLLELAFEQPLEALQVPADFASTSDPLDAQYVTARRLLRCVKDKTGSHKYEKVIESCLVQYGREEPLERCSEGKRASFHSDVVLELEALEDHFRRLHLGDDEDAEHSTFRCG